MRQTAQEELKLVIQQINELTKIYHNAVSSHHISENEFWIWYILILTDGEHSQQSICDAWFLTKQTVNGESCPNCGPISRKIAPPARCRMVCWSRGGLVCGRTLCCGRHSAMERYLI